jgi:hypothetical protein
MTVHSVQLHDDGWYYLCTTTTFADGRSHTNYETSSSAEEARSRSQRQKNWQLSSWQFDTHLYALCAKLWEILHIKLPVPPCETAQNHRNSIVCVIASHTKNHWRKHIMVSHRWSRSHAIEHNYLTVEQPTHIIYNNSIILNICNQHNKFISCMIALNSPDPAVREPTALGTPFLTPMIALNCIIVK